MQTIPHDHPFSLYEVARTISLLIMIRAMFGPKSLPEERYSQTLVENFLTSFQNPLILFLKPLHLNVGRFSPWGRALRNRRRLGQYITGQIATYRQATDPKESILGQVIEKAQRYGPLRDEQIVAELLALLMFGHDTGAATMAWAFAHIYQTPQAVERIRQEALASSVAIVDIVDTLDTLDIVETVDEKTIALQDHPYLAACLNESMRLCPVVVTLVRVAEEALVLAGQPLKANEVIFPCIYVAHHNPAVFEAPHQFRPERFLNGSHDAYSFFPFGFGIRTCVGKPFILRQMMLILSTMIQYFNLALAPGYEAKPSRHLLLIAPQGGTMMVRRGDK